MIGTGIFVVADTFLELRLFLLSKVYLSDTKLKLNFGLFMFKSLFYSKIRLLKNTLGCSLYFWWKLLLYLHLNLGGFLFNRRLKTDSFLLILQEYFLKVFAINSLFKELFHFQPN